MTVGARSRRASIAGAIRRVFFRNGFVTSGTIVVLIFVLLAVFAPLLTPYDPVRSSLRNRLQAPSLVHLLGTDGFGRDVFTRVIYGARVSLGVASTVVVVTTVVGSLLALVAVWFRRFDNLIMRSMDVLMSIPSLVFAIALMGFLGADVRNLVIAIVLTQTPRMTRIARAGMLAQREMAYIDAAGALGGGNARIMFRHLLPNSLTPIVVQATFLFAHTILVEAGLSFLGIGTPPPLASWGNMLAEGRGYMRNAWWLTVVPGLSIMGIVIGLNLLGDGLRDLFDPRLRGV
jgi:peptide/nickel transport system permease protein